MNLPLNPAPSEPQATSAPRFALWNLGFRPFYLVASLFSAISIALWISQYAGYLLKAYLNGSIWHAHEMLFGYTLAVVAGFLLTAVRAWTGLETPTGRALRTLVLLWIAGRLLVLTPYSIAAALIGAAFPVAVALAIAGPLLRSRNRRNYFFVPLLILLGAAELVMHLSYQGRLHWPAQIGVRVGLDIVLFIVAVLSGRVVPMFTNNGVPGASAQRNLRIEQLALGLILVLLCADAFQAMPQVIIVVSIMNALVHAARLSLWQPWKTLRTPLVWILHVAYGWIVIYFVLRAFAAAGFVADPFATHALTIGAIGSMTLGMMMRTSRGHTGRPLVVNGIEVSCFVLIQMAVIVRVFGGIFLPGEYLASVVLSGILWALAFTIFALCYWPILSRVRIDGKAG